MSRAVLDSSAILAVLLNEPGQDVVAGYKGDALVSSINLAEIAAKFADRGAVPAEWLYPFSLMRLEVVAFDEDQALASGQLRQSTRRLGLSLGDRACLQLAAMRGLPAVTADRAWGELEVGVEVRVVRE